MLIIIPPISAIVINASSLDLTAGSRPLPRPFLPWRSGKTDEQADWWLPTTGHPFPSMHPHHIVQLPSRLPVHCRHAYRQRAFATPPRIRNR
ncbi:hypothetical protein VTI74DRAFT_10597 [Chaetomium olivicolor]